MASLILATEEASAFAASAAAVLRDRVWLVEARDTSNGYTSQVAHFEWINIQICDPKSRAFALQQQHGVPRSANGEVDVAAYARAIRGAMAVWHALACCPGFSARENPTFWRQVFHDATPASHGVVSDVPAFLDSMDAPFPRFRLNFAPKDCYDEDMDEPGDAYDWVEQFCSAFFASHDATDENTEVHAILRRLCSVASLSRWHRSVQVQVVFRTPMLRMHTPTGVALQQHPQFLSSVHTLAEEIKARFTFARSNGLFDCRVTECIAMLRGSVRPRDFIEIRQLVPSTALRLKELYVELKDGIEPATLEEFGDAITRSNDVQSLTINMARADSASLQWLRILLSQATSIKSLRLFNTFEGTSTEEQRDKWQLLATALAASSSLRELVLERVQLEDDAVTAIETTLRAINKGNVALTSLTLKPLVTGAPAAVYTALIVRVLGQYLQHLDLSTLSLRGEDVDAILAACPSMKSLQLGVVEHAGGTRLPDLLRQPQSQLVSIAVTSGEDDIREIASALSNQPIEVALSCCHLKELTLGVDAMSTETSDAVLHMLETNQSLQYVQLGLRGGALHHELDARFQRHHNSNLVRKLPVEHKLAFLHALYKSSPLTALSRFDAGIASEVLGFAGHAIQRRFHRN